MVEIHAHQRRLLIGTGLVAALGALIVGVGEFTFQFSPLGGYEGSDYLYFLDVSPSRLTLGHFIAVLAAPLYLVGYWHIAQMLRPAGRWLAGSTQKKWISSSNKLKIRMKVSGHFIVSQLLDVGVRLYCRWVI